DPRRHARQARGGAAGLRPADPARAGASVGGARPVKPWPRAALLRPALDALLAATDVEGRVRGDPVELPHRYTDARDIEVTALLCAALAYGRVDLFKPRLTALLDALGPSPAHVAASSTPAQLLRRAKGFSYRMRDGGEVACLWCGAGAILRARGWLGACFTAHYRRLGGVRPALGAFVEELCAPDFTAITGQRGPTRRLKHLLPHPDRGSACKRLNLFLRWMVRGPDGVDFGLWREVPASELLVPLDTHVHRIGRFIGLTRR